MTKIDLNDERRRNAFLPWKERSGVPGAMAVTVRGRGFDCEVLNASRQFNVQV